MSNTLTITAELAHEIIRSNYNLPDDFRIVISDATESNNNTTTDDGWIQVPSNWRNNYAPLEAEKLEYIEVKYEGIDDSDFGKPIGWTTSWNMESWSPIVRFRPVNKHAR